MQMEVQAVLCQAPTLKSSQPFNVLWCNGDKHLAPDGRQLKDVGFWNLNKHTLQLPSGYVKIAIENGHRNSEFTH